MKLEEEKSFAPIFVLFSVILMAVFIWLVIDETYISRPWKGYQKRFYSLENEFLTDKIGEEQEAFTKTDKYGEYQDIKAKFANAKMIFESDDVQDRLDELKSELERLEKKELKPVTSKLITARNKKLEVEYNFGHYPEKKDKYLQEINKLAAVVDEYEGKQSKLLKKKDGITLKIAALSADKDRYEVELKSMTVEIGKFETQLEGAKKKSPTLQVYQNYIPDMNLADRCMSCHPGINKEESVSDENPFNNHPKRDYYLGNHPTDIFGCVVCHEGQGRALTSVDEAHGEVEYWLTPLLRGEQAQSSCTKCHGLNSDLEEGAEMLVKGRKLFTKLGCYRCHETKGFKETELNERTGPDLTNVAYSTQPEFLIRWIQHPKHVRPDTAMPNFEFSREDAEAIASYLWQISEGSAPQNQMNNFSKDSAAKGKEYFENKGCYVCHSDGKQGSEFAPNLVNIGEKLNYEYAVKWLLDPKSFQPKTIMPSFRLNKTEAEAIAAYLMTLKEKDGAPIGDEILLDASRADKGKDLIKRYGCFSCHKIKGFDGVGRIGVELSQIGSKGIQFLDFGLMEHEILHKVGLKHAHTNVGLARRAWIETKLREPRIFDKGKYKLPKDRLRMPNFELKDDEIEALIVFLTSLTDTKDLPLRFIHKPLEEQNDLFEGFKVVTKFNCIGCHQFSMDKILLKNGVAIEGLIKKEKKDDVFFQLWQECPDLNKAASETVKFQKSDIVEHTEGVGGIVGSLLMENLIKTYSISDKEAVNYLPPKLYGQGKKTQPAWLFSFLKSPITLRPWYKAVMPTFNFRDDEIRKIVKYFAVRDGAPFPYEYVEEKNKDYIAKKEEQVSGYLDSAKALFNSPTVNCISCHIRGNILPDGNPSDWAPDLSIAKDRLRPQWIKNWLSDPQKVQPGTKMPTFFSEGMYQELFPGKPEVQIKAIVDFLMNFNDSPAENVAGGVTNANVNLN